MKNCFFHVSVPDWVTTKPLVRGSALHALSRGHAAITALLIGVIDVYFYRESPGRQRCSSTPSISSSMPQPGPCGSNIHPASILSGSVIISSRQSIPVTSSIGAALGIDAIRCVAAAMPTRHQPLRVRCSRLWRTPTKMGVHLDPIAEHTAQ